MTRLEIATRILAGIFANPEGAYVESDVVVDKALTVADRLIVRDQETAQEALKESTGHE